MRMDAGSDFSVRFLAANRTGFYCRVLEEGVVKRSDAITLLSSDTSSPTVREVIGRPSSPIEFRGAALRRPARDLSAKWRSRVRRMIDAEVRRRIEVTSPPTAAMSVEKIVSETNDIVSIWLRPDAGARMLIRCRANTSPSSGPMASKALIASPHSLPPSAAASPSSSSAIGKARSAGRRRESPRSKPETSSPSNAHAAISIPISTTTRRSCSPARDRRDADHEHDRACHAIRRRDVFAAFGMRRPGVHPLASELAAFLAERQRLKAVLAYSQLNGAPPLPGLPAPKHGRLAAADLLPHAAAPLAEVFLCGRAISSAGA